MQVLQAVQVLEEVAQDLMVLVLELLAQVVEVEDLVQVLAQGQAPVLAQAPVLDLDPDQVHIYLTLVQKVLLTVLLLNLDAMLVVDTTLEDTGTLPYMMQTEML